MYKICKPMLPNEITKDNEYTSNYHNFHPRQLDNKMLTIPLCKTEQRYSVYRGSKLWNCIPKYFSNRPNHTFIKLYKQLLFQT